jgi:hypothetical protein
MGTAVMLRWASSSARSPIGMSAGAVMTGVVMISRTFMASALRQRYAAVRTGGMFTSYIAAPDAPGAGMTWHDIRLEERAMRRTVYLPDDLAEQVDQYLKDHPWLTFSGLVGEALRARVAPPDINALLELAGLVPEADRPVREQPEDRAGSGDR